MDDGSFIVRTTGIFAPDENTGRASGIPRSSVVLDWLNRMKQPLLELWADQSQESLAKQQGAVYEIAWIFLHNQDYYKTSTCGFKLMEWNKWVESHFGKREPTFCKGLHLDHAELTMTSLRIHPAATLESKVPSLEEYALYASPSFTLEQRQPDVWSVWKNDVAYSKLEYAGDIALQFGQLYKILEFKKRGI